VQRSNCSLEGVRSWAAPGEGKNEVPAALLDEVTIPLGAILVSEQDQIASRIDPSVASCVDQQQEREETGNFAVGGSSRRRIRASRIASSSRFCRMSMVPPLAAYPSVKMR
jgi:hypothetical protein